MARYEVTVTLTDTVTGRTLDSDLLCESDDLDEAREEFGFLTEDEEDDDEEDGNDDDEAEEA